MLVEIPRRGDARVFCMQGNGIYSSSFPFSPSLTCQVVPDLMCVWSVNMDLLQDGKLDVVGLFDVSLNGEKKGKSFSFLTGGGAEKATRDKRGNCNNSSSKSNNYNNSSSNTCSDSANKDSNKNYNSRGHSAVQARPMNSPRSPPPPRAPALRTGCMGMPAPRTFPKRRSGGGGTPAGSSPIWCTRTGRPRLPPGPPCPAKSQSRTQSSFPSSRLRRTPGRSVPGRSRGEGRSRQRRKWWTRRGEAATPGVSKTREAALARP